MTEKSLLELIVQQMGYLTDDMRSLKAEVSDLRKGQDHIATKVSDLTGKVDELKEGQQRLEIEVKKTNNVLENDIKPKVEALFDGYVQNASRLDRVESNLRYIG